MRSPYQILVFPFHKQKDKIFFCLFKRNDLNVWQGIAGGGEEGESPLDTAKREALEEAEISSNLKMFQLDSIASIPVVNISGFIWGKDILVIPEYSFGVELNSPKIVLSHEHTIYEWVTYEKALARLNWDSNKTTLWELNYRIVNNLIKVS